MSALSKILGKLPPSHRASLEWFQARRGQEIPFPGWVDGVSMLNARTGIQKPANWQHALSVKETLGGDYEDVPPEKRPDGSWLYQYAMQAANRFGSERSANNALIRCAADQVPVAVVIQTKLGPARYEVLGLGQVTGWGDGYFYLEGYDDTGEIGAQSSFNETSSGYQAITPGDWRKKVKAEIAVRQGGKQFRDAALLDYGYRCAVTGCIEPRVLEAAHVVPYMGKDSNKRDNALLLRADLHILFDQEAVWIDPVTLTLRIAKPLEDPDYAGLDGMKITLPNGIDTESLRRRLSERDAFLAEKLAKKSGTAKL